MRASRGGGAAGELLRVSTRLPAERADGGLAGRAGGQRPDGRYSTARQCSTKLRTPPICGRGRWWGPPRNRADDVGSPAHQDLAAGRVAAAQVG